MLKEEFLYYQTPSDFLGLDVKEDPRKKDLINQSQGFSDFMGTCSLEDFVKKILNVFINGYPNVIKLEFSLFDYQMDLGNSPTILTPKRQIGDLSGFKCNSEEFLYLGITTADRWETIEIKFLNLLTR